MRKSEKRKIRRSQLVSERACAACSKYRTRAGAEWGKRGKRSECEIEGVLWMRVTVNVRMRTRPRQVFLEPRLTELCDRAVAVARVQCRRGKSVLKRANRRFLRRWGILIKDTNEY